MSFHDDLKEILPRLRRHALALTRNRDSMEDLVQDTVLEEVHGDVPEARGQAHHRFQLDGGDAAAGGLDEQELHRTDAPLQPQELARLDDLGELGGYLFLPVIEAHPGPRPPRALWGRWQSRHGAQGEQGSAGGPGTRFTPPWRGCTSRLPGPKPHPAAPPGPR